MPVYKVITPTEERIVKAKNQATAINHVIRPGVTAEVLTTDDMADLMATNAKIEIAGASDEVEAD